MQGNTKGDMMMNTPDKRFKDNSGATLKKLSLGKNLFPANHDSEEEEDPSKLSDTYSMGIKQADL